MGDNAIAKRHSVQADVRHPDSLASNTLTLMPEQYLSMVANFHLSSRAVETISAVGPIFWTDSTHCNGQCFQVVYRKVTKHPKGTKGFEMLLCHDFSTRETRGFFKGGPQILEALAYLRTSDRDIIHPMVLPVIVLSLKIEGRSEASQQEAQNQIRLIEVRLRNTRPVNHASISENEGITLEAVNADLSACHKRVWKRPETYLELIDEFQRALQMTIVPSVYNETTQLFSINLNLQSRIELLRQRMRGIQSSAYTTLHRIDMQRSVLHNILLNQQNQIALQIEKRKQRQEKEKEIAIIGWNRTQLLLSLLGSIFLPMTVVAAVFSTSFFNFHPEPGEKIVSPDFWVFWVVTAPITIIFVACWAFAAIQRGK
ncbi:hypothetical protein L207DRAFT_528818 [Hyaloscypha variabilis F]|uniref:Mg2+ transporter protein n=1 Tax=Hyaloscypha variabilis (strain UAMH 11265 / GT02V1 / F) TaxID=1149755 RepID=A0A2J6RPM6_HYAVF|nr:hypothetical protein L207DRAFT_528818 [Hyaloscypha variabilis F]